MIKRHHGPPMVQKGLVLACGCDTTALSGEKLQQTSTQLGRITSACTCAGSTYRLLIGRYCDWLSEEGVEEETGRNHSSNQFSH
ncbi:hypothetical protein INR49_024093 [Caranx melampygus]|nr:hypothetical protein INR49_024093 [Caranx melampygus]